MKPGRPPRQNVIRIKIGDTGWRPGGDDQVRGEVSEVPAPSNAPVSAYPQPGMRVTTVGAQFRPGVRSAADGFDARSRAALVERGRRSLVEGFLAAVPVSDQGLHVEDDCLGRADLSAPILNWSPASWPPNSVPAALERSPGLREVPEACPVHRGLGGVTPGRSAALAPGARLGGSSTALAWASIRLTIDACRD